MKDNKLHNPPKWAIRLLTWFCRDEFAEEIEGDLTEVYHSRVNNRSVFKANLLFVLGVFSFVKLDVIKLFKPTLQTMLYRSYLKLALRNLFKKNFYGLLNIFGLSVGFCSALFMSLYVLDQLSYDRHISNHENIYRVTTHVEMGAGNMNAAITSKSLGVVMKNEIPEVSAFASFCSFQGLSFELGDTNFQEKKAYLVSNTFFEIFDFTMLRGDTTVLNQSGTVLLSESKAMDLFGSIDILNETIKDDRWGILTIRGIFKDTPQTSHFRPQMLANPLGFSFAEIEDWGNINTSTYIKTNAEPAIIEDKLPAIVDRYMAEGWKKNFDGSGRLSLQKLTDIHLHSDLDFEIQSNGKAEHVYAMSALAIFILIVVGINYVNMSTARATTRFKEIGVRKVLGSVRGTIRIQFIVESLLITLISTVFALALYVVLLPYFNGLTGIEFRIGSLVNQKLMMVFFGMVLLIGVIGAWYPAGFVSRFRSLDVLKSNFKIGGSSLPLSRFLNAIQFSVALIMIIITMIIHHQIEFMKNYDLGYDKDHIVKVDMKERLNPGMARSLKNELLGRSDIKEVTVVKQAPGEEIQSDGIYFEVPGGGLEVHKTNFNTADESFLATLDINLLAGRNFDHNSDEMARVVLVNETLVKALGYQNNEEILTKKVGLPLGEDFYAKVVGVMEDIHLQSLHEEIKPLIVVNFPNISTTLLVLIQGENLTETLNAIDMTTGKMANSNSFSVNMLDQSFWSQYQADELRSKLMTIFSTLTILIALMGLFGLVSYSVEKRVKEMTIRKIFGAAFIDVVLVYFKTFIWVFVGASAISLPLAHYLGDKWLDDFAYRIDMPYQLFIFSTVFLVGIMGLIIVVKSRQSHNLNPIESLREE